jgi:signal transduction histidine kinase
LIDDILDLSRIEARKLSLSIEPVDVVELLSELSTNLEPIAASHEVRLQTAPVPGGLPTVSADRTRLAQILMNFGSNAIKYNRPSGEVTFSASTPDEAKLRVSVRDTGRGIPRDRQDRLFQPFQRAGQENGPIAGTGIGLVITKRLAEMMHGSVGFAGSASPALPDAPGFRSSICLGGGDGGRLRNGCGFGQGRLGLFVRHGELQSLTTIACRRPNGGRCRRDGRNEGPFHFIRPAWAATHGAERDDSRRRWSRAGAR